MEGTIIILRAGQGSGKSTLRRIIVEQAHKRGLCSEEFRIADPLYQFQNVMENWKRRVRQEDIDEGLAEDVPYEKSFKNGPLLQDLGDLVRKHYGTALIEAVITEVDNYLSWSGEVAIVEDCRLPEEENAIKSTFEGAGYKIIVIKLTCPEEIRKSRSRSTWRPTTHITESALNNEGWGEPTYTLDTEVVDQLGMVKWVEDTIMPQLPDKRLKPFKSACVYFNQHLRSAEETTGLGANFKWAYDNEGRKYLQLDSTGPLVKYSEEFVGSLESIVPRIILAAEKELGVSQDEPEPEINSGSGVNE